MEEPRAHTVTPRLAGELAGIAAVGCTAFAGPIRVIPISFLSSPRGTTM
jgi:hypothetical protein